MITTGAIIPAHYPHAPTTRYLSLFIGNRRIVTKNEGSPFVPSGLFPDVCFQMLQTKHTGLLGILSDFPLK